MKTGRSDRTAQAGQENCRELTGSRGKRKRVLVSLSVAAVVLAAVMVGVAIYHTPENRLRRQLDLGNRYLEEQQYEQAVLAFEQAIAIDDRCLEAYTGSVEACLGMGDENGAQDIYERALTVLSGLDADFLAENLDGAVELYLAADEVYDGDFERIVQALEEGFAVTGKDERIKAGLVENYIRLGAKETQDGSYEEALAVYDRLLELDRENPEVIHDLCGCLNRYMDILMEAGDYERIRELAQKYAEAAAEIDFAAILARIEEMERRGDWVEIDPQFFEIRMMGFDLWENHAEEIWDALLPLAQTQVFGGADSFGDIIYGFTMENDVRADYYNPSSMPTADEEGIRINVMQQGGGTTGIRGEIDYQANSDQVWLILQYWDGGYSLSANERTGTPMEFGKFIDIPIGKTAEEWYALIGMEQIKEKGMQTEMEGVYGDTFYPWKFQTEWGDGFYYEYESGNGRREGYLAIDCSGQGEERKIFSVDLIMEPDGGIDVIRICAGKNYAWNYMFSDVLPDVFHIFEQ